MKHTLSFLAAFLVSVLPLKGMEIAQIAGAQEAQRTGNGVSATASPAAGATYAQAAQPFVSGIPEGQKPSIQQERPGLKAIASGLQELGVQVRLSIETSSLIIAQQAPELVKLADKYFYGYELPLDRKKAQEFYTVVARQEREEQGYAKRRLSDMGKTYSQQEINVLYTKAIELLADPAQHKIAAQFFEAIVAQDQYADKRAWSFLHLAEVCSKNSGRNKALDSIHMYLVLASRSEAKEVKLHATAKLADLCYSQKKYNEAFKYYTQVIGEVENTDILAFKACAYLGIMHNKGWGTKRDGNQAIELLKKALNRPCPEKEPAVIALVKAHLGELLLGTAEDAEGRKHLKETAATEQVNSPEAQAQARCALAVIAYDSTTRLESRLAVVEKREGSYCQLL